MRINGLMLSGLAVLLIGCSATREPIVRTETVKVEVPVFVPLPDALTAPVAEPAAPPRDKIDPETGRPTISNEAAAEYLEALRAWGRLGWKKLEAILAKQPKGAL